MTARWALLLACGWLAATVSGVAGFGGALLLLPVLTAAVGPGAAVPVLTVAQLLGNLSRAWFGRREIRWRPALVFSAGAVPAAAAGSRLFVGLPTSAVARLIGVFLLLVVVFRRTPLGRRPVPEHWLWPAGLAVGFISGVAGSSGPLGAAVFLGLKLPPTAYVATEAVPAALTHLAKALTYGLFARLTPHDFLCGLALGGSLVAGSWTGRKVAGRLPARGFAALVEALLIVSAVCLLVPVDGGH